MKKLLLLTLVLLGGFSTAFADDTWTVYVKATAKPYIHAWKGTDATICNNQIMDDCSVTVDGITFNYKKEVTTDTGEFSFLLKKSADWDANKTVDIHNAKNDIYVSYDGTTGYECVLNSETVQFVNDDGWGTIYAYTYDENGFVDVPWPGREITTSAVSNETYNCTVCQGNMSVAKKCIIFNDGNGNQTPDLSFVNSKTYEKSASYTVNYVDYANTTGGRTSWGSVNAYIYGDYEPLGSYRGESMSIINKIKIDGNSLYTLTFRAYPDFDLRKIIFNTYIHEWDEKTADIDFTSGKTYYYDTYYDEGNNWALTSVEKAPTNVTVTLNADGMATLNLPYKLDFSGDIEDLVGAYWVKSITTDQLTATKIDAIAPENTGMLLKGTANANVTIPVSTGDATAIDGNKLHATTVPATIPADYAFILKGASFVRASAGTIPVFKAYLLASDIPDEARELSMMFEDETTGINTMKTIVRSNEVRYNLAGQRVSDNYKGIVISNGKKVIVK